MLNEHCAEAAAFVLDLGQARDSCVRAAGRLRRIPAATVGSVQSGRVHPLLASCNLLENRQKCLNEALDAIKRSQAHFADRDLILIMAARAGCGETFKIR